jgi:hypothetical protein
MKILRIKTKAKCYLILKVEVQVNLDRRMSRAVVGHNYGVNESSLFLYKK